MTRATATGTTVRNTWSPSAVRKASACWLTYDHENHGFGTPLESDETRLTVGT